jgi:hypothetical protein
MLPSCRPLLLLLLLLPTGDQHIPAGRLTGGSSSCRFLCFLSFFAFFLVALAFRLLL